MRRTGYSLFPGRLILIVTLSAFVASCGLVPRIPIQMSRVVQIERYEQTFIVSPQARQSSPDIVAADGTCNDRTTGYFGDVFLRLIGAENWKTLRTNFGQMNYCNELLAGTISLKGNVQLVVYLLESDLDRFEVTGTGSYFLIQGSTDEIIMAGQFEVVPTLQSVDDLRRGYIEIDVQLIPTKVLSGQTFMHESDVRYRIYMDTSRADEDTYSIDYTRKHQAFLGKDLPEESEEFVLFGEIVIEDTGRNTKLLDLRGRTFLRSDY